MTNHPLLAETVLIDGEPKAIKIGEYQYQIMQKYAYESAKSWDDFMIDALYKTYKKLGISHVLLICEEDFERYLKETLPEWLEKKRNKSHE